MLLRVTVKNPAVWEYSCDYSLSLSASSLYKARKYARCFLFYSSVSNLCLWGTLESGKDPLSFTCWIRVGGCWWLHQLLTVNPDKSATHLLACWLLLAHNWIQEALLLLGILFFWGVFTITWALADSWQHTSSDWDGCEVLFLLHPPSNVLTMHFKLTQSIIL